MCQTMAITSLTFFDSSVTVGVANYRNVLSQLLLSTVDQVRHPSTVFCPPLA